MAIKNYTSKVPSVKSLAEIQSDLALHGARKIMLDFDDKGNAAGITFAISVNNQLIGFKITADIDGVLAVFKKQNLKVDREQAERTAWKNVRDWILAQMTFVECGNAKMEEIFLPYLTDGNKRSMKHTQKDNYYYPNTRRAENEKKYIFPICLIALDLGAGVMCAIGGDYKKLIYWIAAATLTAAVTF